MSTRQTASHLQRSGPVFCTLGSPSAPVPSMPRAHSFPTTLIDWRNICIFPRILPAYRPQLHSAASDLAAFELQTMSATWTASEACLPSWSGRSQLRVDRWLEGRQGRNVAPPCGFEGGLPLLQLSLCAVVGGEDTVVREGVGTGVRRALSRSPWSLCCGEPVQVADVALH